MNMQDTITSLLENSFAPSHLEVENETHRHNVPADSESHFKVTLVSDQFNGLPLIKQHRLVNEALAEPLSKIHALALHTYNPDQWQQRQQISPESPPCKGGSSAS